MYTFLSKPPSPDWQLHSKFWVDSRHFLSRHFKVYSRHFQLDTRHFKVDTRQLQLDTRQFQLDTRHF